VVCSACLMATLAILLGVLAGGLASSTPHSFREGWLTLEIPLRSLAFSVVVSALYALHDAPPLDTDLFLGSRPCRIIPASEHAGSHIWHCHRGTGCDALHIVKLAGEPQSGGWLELNEPDRPRLGGKNGRDSLRLRSILLQSCRPYTSGIVWLVTEQRYTSHAQAM